MRKTALTLVSICCAVFLTAPTASAARVAGSDLSDDVVFGTAGIDTLTGGSSNMYWDALFGKANPKSRRKIEKLRGGLGPDLLLGGPGKEVSLGGADTDNIFDEDGTPGDKLDGGVDDDVILSMDGAKDTILCGDGTGDLVFADPIDVLKNCEGVITGSTVAPYSVFYGTAGVDNPSSTTGADFMFGLAGNDTFDGGNGDDTLSGGPGGDTLVGGIGDDTLVDDDGQPGDTVSGGAGAGYDLYLVADGAPTTVHCDDSDGFDEVYADPEDIVDSECDYVVRGSGIVQAVAP